MSVEGTNIQLEGFDELQKKLTIVLPKIVRDMAFTTDAVAAALARKDEEQSAISLKMGQVQQKPILEGKGKDRKPSGEGYLPLRVYSKWSSTSGWVSTTRTVKKGPKKHKVEVPMSMGHFTWAKGTKSRKGSVVAEYGNRLANLWARDVHYTKNSPLVGNPKHLALYRADVTRKARYRWSVTARIISSMGESAVARTEKMFADEFKEL